jgi:hypothetical protein
MIRRLWYAVTLALAVLAAVLAQAAPASADNCSGLRDCYGSAQSAASAVAGITVLLGASVLLAPRLLHRDTPPRPAKPEPDPTLITPPPEAGHEKREPEAVEPPELPGRLRFDEMVRADMAVRRWSEGAVDAATRHPAWFQRARDTRHNQDGSRDEAPAVVFGNADGSHVVVNLLTGDVVHVSNVVAPPRPPSWDVPEALPRRIARETAAATVVTDGYEFFYPVGDAFRVVEYCYLNRIRVLGVAGFVPGSNGFAARPDMILDCSTERNAWEPGEPDTVTPTIEAARRVLGAWQGPPDLHVSFTVTI